MESNSRQSVQCSLRTQEELDSAGAAGLSSVTHLSCGLDPRTVSAGSSDTTDRSVLFLCVTSGNSGAWYRFKGLSVFSVEERIELRKLPHMLHPTTVSQCCYRQHKPLYFSPWPKHVAAMRSVQLYDYTTATCMSCCCCRTSLLMVGL